MFMIIGDTTYIHLMLFLHNSEVRIGWETNEINLATPNIVFEPIKVTLD